MKTNKIFLGLTAAACLGFMGSCSSDYLDLHPESGVDGEQAVATVDNVRRMLYGIASSMNTQYQDTQYNQYNGETYINTWLGDGLGNDYQSQLTISSFGSDALKLKTNQNANYVITMLPWNYCYNLINQANNILDGIDETEGTDSEVNFCKAQALTYRAFAYTKLLMYYAPRWQDSKNGEYYCAVLRTTSDIDNVPACKMIDVLNQIYTDLDTAIELYNSSEEERSFKWEPDLSVAYGVYTRAALIKNDYPTAQTMAHNARQNYTLMSADEYLAGFYKTCGDFMWESASDASSIYYWSHGSHFAANGRYVQTWAEGAGSIDYDLYKKLDPKDIRRQCFITPDKLGVAPAGNPGKLTETDFWNEKLVNSAKNNALNFGPVSRPKDNGKWGMQNFVIRYIKYYLENIFKGDMNSINNDGFMAYYILSEAQTGTSSILIGKNMYGTLVTTPFGAQLKFFSEPPYGISAFPYMRASEMCLAEAEAAYMNNDEATAIKCLTELNSKRIQGYSCNKSGEALLDEIRTTRRIELWGEGQSYTDFKRWNIPMVRNGWQKNSNDGWTLENAGNWPTSVAGTISVKDGNGWTFSMPQSETQYNSAIDKNLVNQPVY